MRKVLFALAIVVISVIQLRADTIAQWNFNSVPADGSASTGSTSPSLGVGTASLVGGVTGTFATGDTVNDPVATDNTGWNTVTYPAINAGNKTRGVQFNVSTVGKENIVITFSLRASNTGSKYVRLQYTTNGTDFVDFPTSTALTAGNVFELKTVDLTGFVGVSGNANFAFRIVTEFEDTATGAGSSGYVSTTASTYTGGGSLRFDAVTVSGTVLVGGNMPPTISAMTNQTIRINQSGTNFFTVGDAETALNSLTVSGSSSNPSLVTTGDITFVGTDASRTVIVAPEANQVGTATITVTVTDGSGSTASSAFTLTVLVANTTPVISSIGRTNTLMNTPITGVPFTIGDLETPGTGLTLSATSSDTTLLPVANITFGGSDTNRTVTLTPAAGQSGAVAINLTVSDGTNSASTAFNVMVVPSASVVFYEPFNYSDGSLRTNSGFLWNTRAGTSGQLQLSSGQISVTSSNTEDISGPLIGTPGSVGSGNVLYACFKVNFSVLPTGNGGDLFAHFGNGSTLRGRIYASTSNAAPGTLRFRVANNTTSNTELAQDLNLNTTYTVVTRYNVDTPATTVWVNPTSESDPSVSATDTATALAVLSYDFREDVGIGTMTVDDVRVATNFADALGAVSPSPIPLNFQISGANVTLTWSNAAFTLQAAPAVTGTYTNVPGATSPYTTSTTGAQKYFRLKF